MPLDPLQVARDAIKPACERGLEAIGAVGRQVRGERRLDDERLRHALSIGVISELAGEVRWQAEGVLCPHAPSHPEIVGAVERGLARGGAEVALHDALALHLVVRLVVWRLEFLTGLRGPATISSCSGSSGSRRMPAFAGSSTIAADNVITASSQSP